MRQDKANKRSSRDPALLQCMGSPSCGIFVPHRFLKTRLCTIRFENRLQDAYEELYACEKCGAARRWGISMPDSPSK